MADSQQGVVSTFNDSRGFGFINSDDERSLFFHQKQVQDGYILHTGDRVQFTVEQSSRHQGKVECRDVVLLERAQKAVKS
jgi:cold shock CspA family protein